MTSLFAPVKPRSFDKTIVAAARFLQCWALFMLARTFQIPADGARAPSWGDYFALRRLLGAGRRADFNRRRARRAWRRWTVFGGVPDPLPLVLEDFALQCAEAPPPQGCAEAAGDLAWTSPGFRFASQKLILQALRGAIVFDPGRPMRIALHPNILWLLLATEPRNSLLAQLVLRRPGFDALAANRAPDLLAPLRMRAASAAIAGAKPHWAGFWDQWVALHVWRTAPAHCLGAPPEAARIIVRLPLLEEEEAAQGEASALVASGFYDRMQKIAAARVWEGSNRARLRPAFDPASPHWPDERPGSFCRGLIIYSRKERSGRC
jgi:hypothetical protein